MSRKIIFMRGLPGSGKSETARKLLAESQSPFAHARRHVQAVLFSTDDYFTTGGGDYKFVPEEIAKAHEWNQARALEAMELGVPLIIIDNTMTQWWEAEPYVTPALARSYEVDFVEPDTPWAKDVEECAKRTTHGVPIEAIQAMADRWEDDPQVRWSLAAARTKLIF